MTEKLLDVSPPTKEASQQPSVEELETARELVRQARTRGVALTGPHGLLKALTKTVIETALDEEMPEHLGYDKHETAGRNGGNSRNGKRSRWLVPNGCLRGWRDRFGRSAVPCEPVIGPGGSPVGQLGAAGHPDPATRVSPSTPNRARFVAAASNEKSAATLVWPRTRARLPPCRRRIRCPSLRSSFGRVARYSACQAGSCWVARARVSSAS